MTDRVYLETIYDLKSEMFCPNCNEPISEYTTPAFYCGRCEEEINYYLKG